MRPVSATSGWSRMTSSPDQPYDGSSTGTPSSSITNRAEANSSASSGFISAHQPDDGSSTGIRRSSVISRPEGNPGNASATFPQFRMNESWGVHTERTSSSNTSFTSPQLACDWSPSGSERSSAISQAETRNARVALPQQPNDNSSASTLQSSNTSRAERINNNSLSFTASPSRLIDTNSVHENEIERNSNNNACLDQLYQQQIGSGSARSSELGNYTHALHPVRNPKVYGNPSVPNTSQRKHQGPSVVTSSNGVTVSPSQDSSLSSVNPPNSSLPQHSITDSETLSSEALGNCSNSGITNNSGLSYNHEFDGNIPGQIADLFNAEDWKKLRGTENPTKVNEDRFSSKRNTSETEQHSTDNNSVWNIKDILIISLILLSFPFILFTILTLVGLFAQ